MTRFRNHVRRTIPVAMAALALGLPLTAVAGGGSAHESHAPAGDHGGRLLEDDGFRLELRIAEDGLPPEMRAWAWRDGEQLDPADVDLRVRLERLGGDSDEVTFAPQDDFLRSRQTVSRPHSFDVIVQATHAGHDYRWRYADHSGRTRISDAVARDAGLTTARVGPATLQRTLTLTGRVRPDPGRIARPAAPYPGTVQAIDVGLFDSVAEGQALATVLARDSLQPTTVRAPFAGTVIERRAAVGDQTGTAPLFVIADLTRVWVMLDAFPEDLKAVETGQRVSVRDMDGATLGTGEITRIAPTSGERQNVHLRVPLANDGGRLRPGQFVHGEVTIGERRAELAVALGALQRYRGFDVVFARFGDRYEVRMVELGMRGSTHAEILDGIAAGTEYVTGNSFLIRADLDKSGVSHSH